LVLALARAEIAANELAQAGWLYEEATRLDSQNAEAWYGLGVADRALAEERLKAAGAPARQESQKLMDTSNAALARAVQLEPDAVGAYMILGESFRIAERYDEAIEEYKAATREKSNFAPAWAGLAVAYSAAGKDEQSLQAASRALALDANDAGTNALIAGTYLRQGDYTRAKPYALRALELQPALSSGHVVLAKIYLKEHQPEKALPELRAAVKDDTDGSTYYLLATTLRQLGNPSEAAAAMRKYKQLHAAHVGPAEKKP
jgi:tetratricopeptide (TPR) repeat protein